MPCSTNNGDSTSGGVLGDSAMSARDGSVDGLVGGAVTEGATFEVFTSSFRLLISGVGAVGIGGVTEANWRVVATTYMI